MRHRLAGILLIVALAGCATEPLIPPPPPPPRAQVVIDTPYRADDFAWSLAVGSARIHGATIPARSCAGKVVALTPETPYSRERIRKLYGSTESANEPIEVVRGRSIANDSHDMIRFVRSARCDAAGAFAFEGLPAGGYFVIAEVSDPNGPQVVMRRVQLAAGRLLRLPLTAPPASH